MRGRLHVPTITGRLGHDRGLLVLTGLVVAVTVVLTAAVAPLTERTADRAVAAAVRDAGLRGAVVATLPQGYDDPAGTEREPRSDVELRQDADYARHELPRRLADVLAPGISTLTTPALHLLDAGPGRYLRLAYVDTPTGPPQVAYRSGRAPRGSAGADRARLTVRAGAEPWPVQVALSRAAATALGLSAGNQVLAEDEQHRRFEVRISGVFDAEDPGDDAWGILPELLDPVRGTSDGIATTSTAALVTAASLPDLRVAAPADDLRQRVVFTPRPSRVGWKRAASVERAVAGLQSRGRSERSITWDSLLVPVLQDADARVDAARGQARVLVLGIVASSLLVLLLAAQLLVRRRAGPIVLARERGASLPAIAGELLVESLLVVACGAAVGITATWLLVGSVGVAWVVAVLVGAAVAAPALGAVTATRATDARRAPANRAARRTAARVRAARRIALELAVLAAAVLSFVALRQRGVVGTAAGADGGPTAAGTSVWWAVACALLLLRLLPPAARALLRSTRRSAGDVAFLLASRVEETAARAVPLLVVTVAVAQLTLGAALAATEQHGQAAGAKLAVGADARLSAAPDASLEQLARAVAGEDGVRAATAARVADDVPASSTRTAEAVRLVVVDAAAYGGVLAASGLPPAPGLARLGAAAGERVPALLVGGARGLDDGLVVQWQDVTVALEVVGTAPQVEAAVGPVVVVDVDAFAAAGAVAAPDTVWAAGPGAGRALEEHRAIGAVDLYADELAARRGAPLPSALVRLAVASAVLLLGLAVLGLVLAAAIEAESRAESLGRLRALGLPDRDLRRVLLGELGVPVVAATAAGTVVGVVAAHATFGSLALERVTGGAAPPGLVLSWWWGSAAVLVLVAAVVAVGTVEWRRLRGTSLARLLRGGAGTASQPR